MKETLFSCVCRGGGGGGGGWEGGSHHSKERIEGDYKDKWPS